MGWIAACLTFAITWPQRITKINKLNVAVAQVQAMQASLIYHSRRDSVQSRTKLRYNTKKQSKHIESEFFCGDWYNSAISIRNI